MLRNLLRVLVFYGVVSLILAAAAFAEDRPANPAIQEEVWAIPITQPTIAYVVRPAGNGPFPLVVMNHGVSLNQRERAFFPIVEFRDAAMWFARRGYMVVAPSGTGYGAAALDEPERGLYSSFYSKIGSCDNPNFHDAGLAVALLDRWIIDYLADQKLIVPDNVIVLGQSAGGFAQRFVRSGRQREQQRAVAARPGFRAVARKGLGGFLDDGVHVGARDSIRRHGRATRLQLDTRTAPFPAVVSPRATPSTKCRH